ncbi:MAG: CehA/McbA family metallohydrolase [Myxococcales bacterium]|nr:CehA/McbA family metallohydrolase [Myxococcales bacterium]MCB9575404.1 CehA/McbA family metallohydrolase [Polyangiaceae bacterium]
MIRLGSSRLPWAPIVALLSVGIALSPAACPAPAKPVEAPAKPVALNGTVVKKLETSEVPHGSRVQARPGDWLISGPLVRAVVAAESGALLDFTVKDFRLDALDELSSVVVLGAMPALLRPTGVVAEGVDGRAELRVERVSTDGRLRVTDRIAPAAGGLVLSTKVTNVTKDPVRVRIGDRLRWYGRLPFAPHQGYVESAKRAAVDFLARPGARMSYALFADTGQLDVDFRVSLRGPTEQLAVGPEREVLAGQSVEQRRHFVVTPGGLDAVARLAWAARGVRLGRARGKVDLHESWGLVEAYDATGGLVSVVEPTADGSFELALPPASYRLELRSPGGTDVQQAKVAAGEAAEVSFIAPAPASVAYRVTDANGDLLPARLNFSGIAPTTDPVLGPPHLAAGAGNASYAWTGEGRVALPSGRYRVTVSHGIEYTLDEQEVEVSRSEGVVLRSTLKRAFELPGVVGCDFHVHAEPSGDSDVPLEDRVQSLLSEGVGFAVATDHNHVTDYSPAVRALSSSRRLETGIGVELTTRDWGHFNAWPYPNGVELPPIPDLAPRELFQAVRQAAPGVVIQVNHPRMGPDIGYFDQAKLDPRALTAEREGASFDFDTVEVYNGFELPNPAEVEKNLSDWFALLEANKRVVAVGNSDSHQLSAQWVGYPRTMVTVPDGAESFAVRVATALRAGHATVSNGPVVELAVEGKGLGELVAAKGDRVHARAVVHAAPWVDVTGVDFVVNGAIAEHADLSGPGAVERDLTVSRDSWVVAIARGNAPLPILFGIRALPFGMTNPVYVDHDGDGEFRKASQ